MDGFVSEFFKYTDDKWMGRRCTTSWLGLRERDLQSTNHSILSAHSCVEEKNRILRTLTQYGIETTVDRTAKKERIRDWIQSSCVYRYQNAASRVPAAPLARDETCRRRIVDPRRK